MESVHEDFNIEDLYLQNNNIEIIYHAGTNKIKEIKGVFSKKTVTKEEEALQALMSVRSIFEITSFEYFCSGIDVREDLTIYNLNQLYKEIPVEGGFFQIGVDNQGNTSFVSGTYVKVNDLQTEPKISYRQGEYMLKLAKGEQIQKIQLVIYGLGDIDPCLCWKYTIISNDPVNDKVIYLDANLGTILYISKTNIA